MANTERIVVQVVVQGQKDLANLEKRTGSTTRSFGKMAAGVLAAAAAFRTINEIVSTSVKSFRDFEFQMAKTRAVTNASEEDFNLLSESAQKLGRSTFFTAQQVAELQTNFGKLGFSTQEILDAQQATLNLAIATDSDLGRATIVAGAAVKGFGLEVSETKRVVDVMTASFAASPLDIEKFQTSMTKVAPIAASAGISIEATSAVMAILADSGHEASIAGTALRQIFLKMINPTSELAKEIGFTVNSTDDFLIAIKNLSEAQIDNLRVQEIVDDRQVAVFNTIRKGTPDIIKFTNAFENASGTAQIMADIIGDTLEGEFKRLTSASEGLKIALVDKLGGGMRNIIKRLTDFLNLLTDNADTTANLVKGLVTAIKFIGLYKLGIFAATKATVAWRAATMALNGTLNITRKALARTGIGLLAIGLGELATRFLTASDDAEKFEGNLKGINDETERQLEVSDEALKSQGIIGGQSDDDRAKQEQIDRDERFAKEVEDYDNLLADQMSRLTNQLINKQITQDEFDEQAFTKEQLHLSNMLGLYDRYGKNTAQINNEILTNELNRIQTVAEEEKRKRQEQIDSVDNLGTQLIRLAGEDKKLQGIRKAGIALSASATIANNIQALSEASVGVAKQSRLLFPANIVAMATTLGTIVSLFANIKALKSSFGDGGVVESFANGGMVHGRSHAQGGEKFAVGGRVVELEGGEAVINKRSTAMFRNQLSAMNAAGGGVKFADGGLLNMPSFSQQEFNALNQNQMMGAMSSSSGVVVVEADITESQNTVNVIQAQATI